jgi:hypothetical protein
VSQDMVTVKPSERLMDNWAIGQLINWAAGKQGDEKTKTLLTKELYGLAAELAGPTPTPVERVLAETAATAWFAYRLHEASYAAAVAGGAVRPAAVKACRSPRPRAKRRSASAIRPNVLARPRCGVGHPARLRFAPRAIGAEANRATLPFPNTARGLPRYTIAKV